MSNGAAGKKQSTSPWVYVGVSCGCLALIVVIGLVAMTTYCVRAVREWEATLKDPLKRAAKVQEIMGYEDVPDGYYPAFGISIPFVLELAALADQEPDEDGEIDGPIERAVFYVRVSNLLARDQDFQDILEGRKDMSELFEGADLRVRSGDNLGGGVIIVDGQEIRYVSHRGNLFIQNHPLEGVLSLFFVKCPGRARPGVGGWLMPDPAPDVPAQTADLTGTPADTEALTAFLSQFTFCES